MSSKMGHAAGVRLFALSVIVLLARTTVCFELSLNECTCNDCEQGSPSNQLWTSTYITDEESNTQKVTIRLQQGKVGCDDSTQRYDRISINLLDQPSTEEITGVAEKTGETVTLDFDKESVLTLHDYNYRVLEQFTPESFCIRRINGSHSTLDICCGRHKSCIRKCCPFGYSFTNDLATPCNVSDVGGWQYLSRLMKSSNGENYEKSEMHDDFGSQVRTGFPECQIFPYNITTTLSTALGSPRRPFRLLKDGTLKILGRGITWKTKMESVDYCVDSLSRPQDQRDLTCGMEEQDVLLLCIKEIENHILPNDWIFRVVYMATLGKAIFFLVATAVVHFLLWEKQNIHAWTILCYVVTLTGFYICLLVIYVEETRKRTLLEHHEPFISQQWCFALGVVTHFMGIFSFSWLSVINFDLWWTFRILKPMHQRGFDSKRLLCYAGFALSVPTIVVSIAALFQLKYEKRSGIEPCRKTAEDYTVYPMYGQDSCFLANSSQPYYFYLPVGVLLLANLIFYLCTSCQMLRIYNATRRISDGNSKKQKQSCELFLKLFLVMGITWIFQVILSIVENDESKETLLSVLYAIFDMVNLFQAIAIFVIFVCKRETLRALEIKYPCLKSCLHPCGGAYKPRRIISRSTDGSTKMSRTELTKHHSIESSSGSEPRRDSELANFS